MNWLIFTILAILARSTYSIATRLLSTDVKVSPITQSFILILSGGLLSLLMVPFFGSPTVANLAPQWLPIGLMLSASVAANIIYFKGQKFLGASTTQIAFSSMLIWGTILSMIFLGSSFSLRQMLGIALMFGAIMLIQYKKEGLQFDNNVLLIILSAGLFAVMQVSSATISQTIDTSTYLLLRSFGAASIIFLIYFKTIISELPKLKNQVKNSLKRMLFASGTSTLYFVFSFLAFKNAPDRGTVIVLLTSQVVLSVIFGIIFLKERENMKKKLLAGAIAFIAGILIKL